MYLSSSKPVEGKILYIVKGFRNNTGNATSKMFLCHTQRQIH